MYKLSSIVISSLMMTIFLFIPSVVSGQGSSIPDVYIGSDEVIKVPLAKRQANYILPEAPDSLGSFLPELFTLKVKQIIPQATDKIVPTFRIGFSSTANTFLSSVVYLPCKAVPRISFSGDYSHPESDFSMTQLKLSLLTQVFRNLNQHHILGYFDTHTEKLHNRIYGYSLLFNTPNLSFGGVLVSNMESRLALEHSEQSIFGGSSLNKTGIVLENIHNVSWSASVMENQITAHNDYLGLRMMYAIPMAEYVLSKLQVGVLTDFERILPAVDISKRVVFSPGRYFDISNRASIGDCSSTSLAEQYPWSAQPSNLKAKLTPVNLHLGLYDTTADVGKPNSFGILNNCLFSYNATRVTANPLSGYTEIEVVRNIKNTTTITSRWDFPNASISQDVNLNFEYIHNGMWGRCSYAPLLTAETKMQYQIGAVEFELNLTQEYLSIDESEKAIPAVFDLGLQVKYPLTRTILLTSWWKNLFNTPYHYQGDIPKSGRTVGLAFSYRPAM